MNNNNKNNNLHCRNSFSNLNSLISNNIKKINFHTCFSLLDPVIPLVFSKKYTIINYIKNNYNLKLIPYDKPNYNLVVWATNLFSTVGIIFTQN